ncbi:unnamed protein product [Haemonchus placei]|uniref:COesterase domain-containing protein n=1 Tax=Haemonchus placei TaxID=6290 RepID=A0A0N4X2R1_HAEPC|nr:unnamed protein product [Haemonchus placei]
MGHGPSTPRPWRDSRLVKTKFGSIIGRRFVFGEKEVDAFQGIPFAKPPVGELRFKVYFRQLFQVDAFQGIPFAKPPVGELRFKKPEWPDPWDDVKVTKGFAARGIQKDPHFFEKMKLGKISEDNLYLNVFTPVWSPDTGSGGFPVLVFVHGGGYVSDSSVKYGDVGICEHLCTKDVVVVTIQYRLGFLGFFSTGDEHCPGNFALWDQTLALRWVQENIAAFNGDPGNVTVMGQSAGGASVDLLSICPHSRDLFHKVVPMAGNASCSWALHDNMVEECRKFAERNGVHNTHDSKKVDKMEKSSVGNTCPVGPRLDFDFIPKSVSELRKEAPAKPMLIGCCASEGLIFCKFTLMGFEKHPSLSSIMEQISRLIPEKHQPRLFKKIREEVFEKLAVNPQNPVIVARAFTEILGDLFVNVGVQKTVLETLEAHDAPVYFYSYDYFNPKNATHCTELAYIFAVGIIWHFDFNDDDKRMLEMTTRMWTNFAKYGNPNGVAEIPSSSVPCDRPFTWEPATLSNPQRHLAISLRPEMKDEYKNGRPLLIAQLRRSKSESNGV